VCEVIHNNSRALILSIRNSWEGKLVFDTIFFQIKNWWLEDKMDSMEEFELLESKHTRVHHDEDIKEVIRVH
jgi:hypothetical protein